MNSANTTPLSQSRSEQGFIQFPQEGFLNPQRLLLMLAILHPGMHVADFGCGSGYFTLPIAKLVGQGGHVNAIDVLPKALEAINSAAKLEGLFNIRPIRGNLEAQGGSQLALRSQDVVFLVNILYQSRVKNALLQEAKRVLKPEGRLVIIDWEKQAPVRPSQGYFLTQEEGAVLARSMAFRVQRRFAAGRYHWGLLLVNNEGSGQS